jgi:hypothetical protein
MSRFMVLPKIGVMTKLIILYKLLRGRFRLFWKLCPGCNSDAPKVDDCKVCGGDRQAFYKWSKVVKCDWWGRYLKLIKRV